MSCILTRQLTINNIGTALLAKVQPAADEAMVKAGQVGVARKLFFATVGRGQRRRAITAPIRYSKVAIHTLYRH